MGLYRSAGFQEDVLYGVTLEKAIQAFCVDRFFGFLSVFAVFAGFLHEI
jgi:hypothetical protein